VDYVLHAILDYIVDRCLPIVDTIEESVTVMEQRSLNAFLERDD
jgi:magnesium transporter